jgi:6-phosphogluconolactonase
MKSLRVFSDLKDMAQTIALQWQEQAGQMASEGRVFSVVLSGGDTAEQIYSRLIEQDCFNQILWNRVHLFWADERCVPPESEESNYGNCRRFLLNHIPIPIENVHRIRGEDDPEVESIRYALEIQEHALLRKGQTNTFDWVFLGIGSDGHTASLFYGDDSIDSSNLCELVRHPETGQPRITLTPSAIRKSNRTTYHVIGREKSGIILDLVSQKGSHINYPAAHISGECYLDKEAASKLNSKTIGL